MFKEAAKMPKKRTSKNVGTLPCCLLVIIQLFERRSAKKLEQRLC